MAADTNEPSPAVSSARGRGRRSFGIIAGMFAAVVLVVLFALAFALLRQPGSQTPLGLIPAGAPRAQTPIGTASSPAGAPVPADWVTYRDPAGFFTIRIPPQWHATVSTGKGWSGDRTGSYSYTSENVNLGPGTRVPRDTYADVYIQPIPNAFARQWNCKAFNGPFDSTIAGLPATDLGGTWLLNTEDAHFQISTPFSFNPGGVEIHAGSPLPTPVPPATVSAEQHLVEMVISTFRPIPATPLRCG